MGGDLWVESSLGLGSCFHFTARLGYASRQEKGYCPVLNQTALVVDDFDLARIQVASQLALFGISATQASSATQALAWLSAQSDLPDWIFIDWLMPEQDGVWLYQQIEQRYPQLLSRCVFMSFYDWSKMQAVVQALGVTYAFAKPILPSQLSKIFDVDAPHSAFSSSPVQQTVPNLRGKSILLVEDNALNQQIAQELLLPTQAQIVLADNGEQAIQQVKACSFDLILMDIQMPVLDGVRASEQIRALPEGKGVPIVAMTAHAFESEKQRCYDAGMNDHISKPIIPANLYDILVKWLGGELLSTPTIPLSNDHSDFVGLQGIDIAKALLQMSGSRALLKQSLCHFSTHYAQACQMIVMHIDARDRAQALLDVHTLKGLTATLAMVDLVPSLSQLEQQLSDEAFPLKDCVLPRHFERDFEQMCRQLTDFCAASQAPQALIQNDGNDLDNETLKQQLLHLLGDCSGDSVPYFAQYQKQFSQLFGSVNALIIQQYIEQFAFSEAYNVISSTYSSPRSANEV
jgi:polar amino acid transport system substrate-binding protein